MRRAPAVLVALAVSAVLAAEPAELPASLEVARSKLELELTLATSWRSSDHKLRALDDQARLLARFDVTPREGGLVDAAPRRLEVTRHKWGRISGFFSDDEPDARGDARWEQGAGVAPPSWRLRVSPRGEAVAEVDSAQPVWHLEAWLTPFDKSSGEEARLRRLVHYTDLGFFGAPPLAAGARFETTQRLELGESGLTNKLVLVDATYALTVTSEADVLRVAGPLTGVKMVRGENPKSRRVDEWLDVAFAHGGPKATGELVATFDPAKKAWREVKSSLALEYRARFDGGSGRATFERKLRATWD